MITIDMKRAGDPPRTLKLHPDDTVAIVLNDFGLPAGTVFADGLVLLDRVPQGHKVALVDHAAGAPIKRYGEIIGAAVKPIARGAWVEELLVQLPAPVRLDKLEMATRVPKPLPPLDGFTFEGYRNADGSVGTKNVLGISTSVQCVAGTLEYAVKRIRQGTVAALQECRRRRTSDTRLRLWRGDIGTGSESADPDIAEPSA